MVDEIFQSKGIQPDREQFEELLYSNLSEEQLMQRLHRKAGRHTKSIHSSKRSEGELQRRRRVVEEFYQTNYPDYYNEDRIEQMVQSSIP